MFEVALSSSSNSVDKAIDEYHNSSSFSSYNSSNNDNSSSGSSMDKGYISGVARFPLKVI